MSLTQERNRAMRVAYNHARNGNGERAEEWYEIAKSFAQPTAQQDTHLDDLLALACGPIPGQLDIEGKEAVPASIRHQL